MRLDLIGDVHGELGALEALLSGLGYDRETLVHPQGRVPVFLGDLIDRGPHGLEVAERVMRAVEKGRAICLMGNHEYNLIGWAMQLPRFRKPKRSNRPTTEAVSANRARWAPVIAFFRSLPLSLVLPDLRVVHAAWHRESLVALGQRLASPAPGNPPLGRGVPGPAAALWEHVEHHSPYLATRRRPDLPGPLPGQDDPPHAILMKGAEAAAPAFRDNDGTERIRIRVPWWQGDRSSVLSDRPQVFGHYWNLPPVSGDFTPPHPSGTSMLRNWQQATLRDHPELSGGDLPRLDRCPCTEDVVCVDFNGVTAGSRETACVGAMRHPEREVVWALARRGARPVP